MRRSSSRKKMSRRGRTNRRMRSPRRKRSRSRQRGGGLFLGRHAGQMALGKVRESKEGIAAEKKARAWAAAKYTRRADELKAEAMNKRAKWERRAQEWVPPAIKTATVDALATAQSAAGEQMKKEWNKHSKVREGITSLTSPANRAAMVTKLAHHPLPGSIINPETQKLTNEIVQLYKRGVNAHEKGNYKDAVGHYRDALGIELDNPATPWPASPSKEELNAKLKEAAKLWMARSRSRT